MTVPLKMAVLSILGLCIAYFAQQYVSSPQVSIRSDLGPKLSPGAVILLPRDPTFRNETKRWVEHQAPQFTASVTVADERDIQETILYANCHGTPFLATSGKHGDHPSLGKLKHAIQIDMKKIDKIEISADGNSAILGGGLKNKKLSETLAAANKRTVTGVCDCVGIGGLMLGGGHGLLQGQKGLVADQMVEARIVLANGTAVVASDESHPDLFWALKGAGHNFGVMTEVKVKIYEAVGHKYWAYETIIFTGDKVEAVFKLANEMKQTQAPQTSHFGIYMLMPEMDPVNPMLIYTIIHDGSEAEVSALAVPLHNLGPVTTQKGTMESTRLPALFYSSQDDLACQHGLAEYMRFPVDVKDYNPSSMVQLYDHFRTTVQQQPLLNSSWVAIEGYSVQGVQTIPADSTAFPHRQEELLIALFARFEDNIPNPKSEALAFGRESVRILQLGTNSSEAYAYLNYASGDESLQSVYGYEPWRLEKLTSLKRIYDPDGRFDHFVPIPR